MRFEYWTEGFIFIGIFFVIVGLPCIFVGILGTRLIDYIGVHPSKSSPMQLKVTLQLIVVQMISFLILAVFFHMFSD
jgi:hypothetical protein